MEMILTGLFMAFAVWLFWRTINADGPGPQ